MSWLSIEGETVDEEPRGLAFAIIGDFEELLAEYDIMIPSVDREGREEEACIYGEKYYELEEEIVGILMRKTEETQEDSFKRSWLR